MAVGDVSDEPGDGERRLVDELVVEALVPHVAAEDAPVRDQARHRDADVVVDLEDLLLVGGEVRVLGHLQRSDDGVRFVLRAGGRKSGKKPASVLGARAGEEEEAEGTGKGGAPLDATRSDSL